jgi:hypothetical protein
MSLRSLLLRICLIGLVALAMQLLASEGRTAKAAHAGPAQKPLVNFRSPRRIQIIYTGSAKAVEALKEGGATPTALASADFNADGARDVVAGYATKDGGVLTLLLGNPDAFAPTDTKLFQKAMRGSIAETFLPKAQAFAVPESPDLLVSGDFNRDGKPDVLMASRGGHLYILAGDGKGGLLAPQLVPVSGSVSALAVTGDGHVAVSMEGPKGAEVRILAPSSHGLVAGAQFKLPERGDSIAWGDLGGGADLAITAGSDVVVIYNALSVKPQTEAVKLPFSALGLALGNFIWNREGRAEISVLAGDGSIHILQHGTLDTRPIASEDAAGRRAELKAKRKQHPAPESLGNWAIVKTLAERGPTPAGPVSPSAFNSPRLAASPTDDLLLLDGERKQLNIFDTSGKTARSSQSVLFSSAPVAALALPQKIDASRDVVVLTSAGSAPVLISDDADPIYSVTTTADIDSVGACGTGSSVTTSGPPLSLREAICEANNSGPGTYTINVPAGTYSLSLQTTGGNGSLPTTSAELQVGMQSGETITISGAGAGTTIIQQTDGVDRVIEQDELGSTGIPLTIQNLTLTGGNCSTGLDCGFSGGALLGGGFSGDSLTLTSVTVENSSEQADTPALGGGNQGGGVAMAGPGFTITNSTFSGNSVTSSTDSGYGGGVEFLDDIIGSLTVTGSTFTGNTAAASSIGAQGGGLWIDLQSIGDTATISSSTFTGNSAAGSNGVGGAIYAAGLTTVTNSRIAGNTAAGGGSGFWEQGYPGTPADGVGTVRDNWWGCNGGPGTSGCDTTEASPIGADDASVVFNPWLVLSIGASPTSINIDDTSTLTADLTHNSSGTGGFSVPNGTPLTFGGTLGTASPTGTTLSSGGAASTFTAGSVGGVGSGTATVDNETVSATIDIIGTPVLAVAKSHSGNFTQGATDVWNIQVSNSAASVLDATTGATVTVSDTLPSGYTLSGFSGAGWGCVGIGTGNVTCTSTQVVSGGGGLFSLLSFTVNVPANSPTSVTNIAQAWGGGDTTHTGPGTAATSNPDMVNVIQIPASVTIDSGGTQSTTVSTNFPAGLVVTVEDANGQIIANRTVNFTANPGGSGQSGAFLSGTGTVTTNSSGIANAGTFIANTIAGSYTVTAMAGSTTATFNLTNNPGAAANIILTSGSGQSTQVDTAFTSPLIATVTDMFGNAVPGASVTFTAPTGTTPGLFFSNAFNSIGVTTNTLGQASSGTMTANGYPGGPYNVEVISGGATNLFQLTNLGKSQTTFASLTATAATIDVFGFGFTAPSGQLAFTDVTSSTPVTPPVTLNTSTATTALTAQATTSTGANSLPVWTVLGDLNGDDNLDLVTSVYGTDSVSVQLGNGDGTFQAATSYLISAGFGPAEVHLATIRVPGHPPDIIVGSFNTNQIAVLLNNGDGTFGAPTFYTVGSATNTTTSLTTGDFNHDGNLDVAVANAGDNTISILLGNGSGGLTVQSPAISVGHEPEAIRAGDFNGDGYSDLAVANYLDGTVTTLLNNQDGTFTNTTVSVGSGAHSGPQALAVTGSGSSLKLAVANYNDDTVSVMASAGDGTFGAQTIVMAGNGPDDVNFADFNGDGIPDLVVTNYTDGSVDLLLGSSGGAYTLVGPFNVGNSPYSAAVGDIDLDGTPDVVVSNCFSNNTGVLLDGTQIAVPYSGLSLAAGNMLNATYTPDGASAYASSTSPNVTAP